MIESKCHEILLIVYIIFRVILNNKPVSGKRQPRTWCHWKKKKERDQNQVGLLEKIHFIYSETATTLIRGLKKEREKNLNMA